MLAREKQDVTVIDENQTALQNCAESNDILTILGNATSPSTLVKANVQQADLVIAATNSDEVNIVASMMCKRLGAGKVIARVRNDELLGKDAPIKPEDLGIDFIINPELSLAEEIVLLVKRAAATDLIELAEGKMQVIGIRLPKDSPVINLSLSEYAQHNKNIDFRVVAIHRGAITIIPSGKEKLRANDQIFVIALSHDIKQIIRSTGIGERSVQEIMIAGGSQVGRRVAQMLQAAGKGWHIKLLEPDYDTSYQVACEQRGILVLHGDPTDPRLLASEGITDTDVFIAVTNDEESNIISCLMAKHLQVAKVIAMVSKPDYIPLSQTIGLDASVNKKTSISNQIHQIILGENLLKVAALNGIDAEILQIKLPATSKLAGKAVNKLNLDLCMIGGIIRNGEVYIATGDSVMMPEDNILVFCKHSAINQVVAYLQ
jgi:trk system potassium uptake protein TrkA